VHKPGSRAAGSREEFRCPVTSYPFTRPDELSERDFECRPRAHQSVIVSSSQRAIVDEAQNLSPQMLEEIRLLTNLETSTEKLLQIVLAGQPELEQKLNQPQLRQLRQRITLRAKTRQLTLEETHGYIVERMRIAGAENPDIFSPEAVAAVHRYARGIPRVTNLLCEHALVSSFACQQNPVPAEIVEEVARDFDLHIVDPLAQAPPPAPSLAVPNAGVTNGDQPPLIESLLQALNTLVDRINQAEANANAESDTEHKTSNSS
jgi:hypothetical protein